MVSAFPYSLSLFLPESSVSFTPHPQTTAAARTTTPQASVPIGSIFPYFCLHLSPTTQTPSSFNLYWCADLLTLNAPEVPSHSRRIPLIRQYISQKIPGPHKIQPCPWAPRNPRTHGSPPLSSWTRSRPSHRRKKQRYLPLPQFLFHDAHARIDLMAASRESFYHLICLFMALRFSEDLSICRNDRIRS